MGMQKLYIIAIASSLLFAVETKRVNIDGSPPDVSAFSDGGMKTIFTHHTDVFGEPSDSETWSTDVVNVSGVDRLKIILTSDLFSTGKSKPVLTKILKRMLGDKKGLKALWIHDARAGWGHFDMAQVWLMDTIPEVKQFSNCGIDQDFGLWISRWNEQGEENTLTLTENIGKSMIPFGGMGYNKISVDAVKQRIDESAVLYVPGGNPFTLMENIRSPEGQEVWNYALEKIKAGELVYISRSAGTIVAGKTTDASSDPRPDHWTSDDLAGLDLLPWSLAFRPHYHAFYVMTQEPHTPEWRRNNPPTQWSQDDFLEGLAENHPGVRGVRIRDGDILALYGGRMALMHGDSAAKDTDDDHTELFTAEDGTPLEKVKLRNGIDHWCCCSEDESGSESICTFQTKDCSSRGYLSWMHKDSKVTWSWNQVPDEMKHLRNAGRCVVKDADIKSWIH